MTANETPRRLLALVRPTSRHIVCPNCGADPIDTFDRPYSGSVIKTTGICASGHAWIIEWAA